MSFVTRRSVPVAAFLAASLVSALPAQTSLPALHRTDRNHAVALQLTLDRPSYVLFILRNPNGSLETATPDTTVTPLPAGDHVIVVPRIPGISTQPLPPAHFGNCWDTRLNDDGTTTQTWNGNCGLLDTPTALAAGWAAIMNPPPSAGSQALLAVDLGASASIEVVDSILDRLRPTATVKDILAALAKGLGLPLDTFRWTATSF